MARARDRGYSSYVIRLLTILALAAGGLLWPAGLSAQQPDRCEAVVCCLSPATPAHCASDATRATQQNHHAACPTNGGPCDCAISPERDRRPAPDAPLPRSAPDRLPVSTSQSTEVRSTIAPEPLPARAPAWSPDRLGSRTHNETQALLGIWRT